MRFGWSGTRVNDAHAAISALGLHVQAETFEPAQVAGKTWTMFSTFGNHDGPYTRNPNFWLADYDFTCVPTCQFNSGLSKTPRGALVTRRHLLSATHAGYTNGATLYFVGNDGEVYSRTVLSSTDVGFDTLVVRLSSDLPATVVPCKVLPANIESLLTGDSLLDNLIPIITVNQYSQAVARKWSGISTQSGARKYHINQTITTAPFTSFSTNVVSGDSGSPSFLLVDGEAVLVGTQHTTGSGPLTATLLSLIGTAIDAMDPTYNVMVADLAGFA
jgi:hypothetical protein